MNAGELPSAGISGGESSSQRTRPRRRWRIWLALLIVAGAGVWWRAVRWETPQARLEREVRRILSPVRKQDRTSFNLYSVAEAMHDWPRPFPKFAEWLMGREAWNEDASEELASLGQPAIPILTNLLVQDRSSSARSTVAQALGYMRDPHLAPGLIAAYDREKQPMVRSVILFALGLIGDEASGPFLISVLQGTNDSTVRASAASALSDFQSPDVLVALTNSLLTEVDDNVQFSVVSSLSARPEPAIKPALLAALATDSNSRLRGQVVRALENHPGDDTTTALLTALREDPDTQIVRVAAIWGLRNLTNAAVRAALFEAIGQVSPEVRGAAAGALAGFPGADTESALVELLATDPIGSVRSAAINALAALITSQTNRVLLAPLVKCLQTDADPDVRAQAASALGRTGGEEAVNVLREALEKEHKGRVQAEAIGGIYRQQGREMTALLLKLLSDPNLESEARVEAVRCLGQTRDASAAEKLAALLSQEPEESMRCAVARALGLLDSPTAITALTNALAKDDSVMVRAEVAGALGNVRSGRNIAGAALVVALQNDDGNAMGGLSVRMPALLALGKLRETNALSPLLEILRHDPDNQMRANAAEALGRLGGAEAIPHLETAYRKDRNREVRTKALGSLAQLTGPSRTEFFINAFETDPISRAALARTLGRIGTPEAVTALLKALNEGGWSDRRALIEALGDAGDSRAIEPLMNILEKERDNTKRAAAASALGGLGNSRAISLLEIALQDHVPSVRQEAAWALGHIGDPKAVSALRQALNDRVSETRFAVAFALAEVGDPLAAPALETLLQNADERTRLAAASALAFLGSEQGMPVLRTTLYSRETWQRFTALISLLRLNTAGARQILTNCPEADPALAAVIEGGLRVGGSGAATNLLATANDEESMTEDYRYFGARALVLFNDPATLPALEATANDAEDDVRLAVRVAIRRIRKRSVTDSR